MQESGFLFIDKPEGWTSFDVVAKLRGITGIRKIGHTGTLDPFATGLLLVAVGRSATKEIDSFMKLPKCYDTTIRIGATTETLDTEAEEIIDASFTPKSDEAIKTAINELKSQTSQIPPNFAAIKKNGKKLYELARAGKEVKVDPRPIAINRFEISRVESTNTYQDISTEICVSSGTYIRAIARDLGETLETTGYCTQLRRTSIAGANIEDTVRVEEIGQDSWQKYLISVDETKSCVLNSI
jgi:tRNA pseudouridine55 synthase